MVSYAFDVHWFDTTDSPALDGRNTTNLAEAGTLVLEWTRLSDLTGDATYGALAQRAEEYLLDPQPQSLAEPFPGLVGSNIGINNGSFVDGDGGWGGGDDSFYEYLIKVSSGSLLSC
jgi:mannosyl-oligosaccharide alpha-1,2-mannosidase